MVVNSSEEELLKQLIDAGNGLLHPPLSTDELLNQLDQLEHLLSKVKQSPPASVQDALKPSISALISNQLVRHSDMDVRVSVTSCIGEIMRIVAPDPPYGDEQMKEFFQLALGAFGKLSHMSGRCYAKAVSILEAFATYKACVMMLDLEEDSLVIEMFQLFLATIRSDHPDYVIIAMEKIMTLVIEESDDIQFELLSLLVDTVKKENQNVSPLTYRLGQKVLENCAVKLQSCLPKALSSMTVALDDYAEIISSICRNATVNKKALEVGLAKGCASKPLVDIATEELARGDVYDGEVGQPACRLSTSPGSGTNGPSKCFLDVIADKTNNDTSKGENFLETLQLGNQLKKRGRKRAIVQVANKSAQGSQEAHILKRRDRKPNSLIKPEEGYDHPWTIAFGKNPRRRKYCKKPEEGQLKNARLNEKADVIDAGCGLNLLSTTGDATAGSAVKTSGSLPTTESSREGSLFREPAKAIRKRKCTPAREKASGKPVLLEDNCEKIVGRKIKVWWPTDQTFYEGSISSFDHSKKRHKITYDDGEEEILDLTEERWELVGDVSSDPGVENTPVHQSSSNMLLSDAINLFRSSRKRRKVSNVGGDDSKLSTGEKKSTAGRRKFKSVGASRSTLSDERSKVVRSKSNSVGLDKTSKVGRSKSMSEGAKGSKTSKDVRSKSMPEDQDGIMKDVGNKSLSEGDEGSMKDVRNKSKSEGDEGSVKDVRNKSKCEGDDGSIKDPSSKSKSDGRVLQESVKDDQSKSASKGQKGSMKGVKSKTKSEGRDESLKNGRSKKSKSDGSDERLKVVGRSKSKSSNGSLKVAGRKSKNGSDATVKVGRSRSKSGSENSKVVGRKPKSKVGQEENDSKPADSSKIEIVDVGGYRVKASAAPTLTAIFAKYDDIAAKCRFKSPAVRASLLEVVCCVVQKLRSSDFDVIVSDLNNIKSEMSDAVDGNLDVSWLQEYLEEIQRLAEATKRSSLLKGETAKTIKVSKAAEKDLKERKAELADAKEKLVAAQKIFEEAETSMKAAERSVQVLACVMRKLEEDVSKSLVIDNWQDRLNELL